MSQYKDYGYDNDQLSGEHAYILPVLRKKMKNANAETTLDIGCGNGSVARQLMNEGFDMYGIDASEKGITLAKAKHPDRFFLVDVTENKLHKDLAGKRFDTIISVEVIEHLYDPRAFVLLCKSILLDNPQGGNLILTTPYHGYFKNLILALTGKLDNHFSVLWDGGHIKFWSKKTMTKLLEEAGFTVEEFSGAGRIPFLWKSMIIRASIRQS